MATPSARQKLGAAVNWFPGHMVKATRDIKQRLKSVDLVIEVRDARIPLSSGNQQLEEMIGSKRRLVVLNKRDLANPNLEQSWRDYFQARQQNHLLVSAHQWSSVRLLLEEVRRWLRRECPNEPTLLSMVVGVPNVGKSAVINGLHCLGSGLEQGLQKRAAVGPLPGVTRHLACFKVGDRPSTYVLDTPGVMVPNIGDVEVGLRLALTGAVKDAAVGEERLARYLLSILTTRSLAAKPGPRRGNHGPLLSREGLSGPVAYVREALALPWEGGEGLDVTECMEGHVDRQMDLLRRRFKIPAERAEGLDVVSRQLLHLYRQGSLGRMTLDPVPGKRFS